ncbi:protein of unknown function [Hyphomicrobium sp. MC1]|nr:protein of unknown function [Hyphomicrobium sp. MC1]
MRPFQSPLVSGDEAPMFDVANLRRDEVLAKSMLSRTGVRAKFNHRRDCFASDLFPPLAGREQIKAPG